MASYYSVKMDKASATIALALQGRWTVASLSSIGDALTEDLFKGFKKITFDGTDVEDLDTSAAWYLYDLAERLKKSGVAVMVGNFHDNHRRILERVSALPHVKTPSANPSHPTYAFFADIGRQVVDIIKDSRTGTAFFGEFITSLADGILRPRHLRLRSVFFHVNEAGLKAVPIIALMGFSLSFVTAYQGAYQLQRFDATVFTIDLVALSTLRELGVLLAAIMLAGRSGSAFAAQIGTMKLNEEVDALQTMGVSPFEALVLPRLLAILISLPLLTIITDLTGILGGYAYMSSFLDYSWLQYFARLQQAVEMKHFYVGLSKAPFFAILIGIVGCMQGLRASGSAEEVGRRTITAVVQAIFLVIAADAIFSIIFTKMGI